MPCNRKSSLTGSQPSRFLKSSFQHVFGKKQNKAERLSERHGWVDLAVEGRGKANKLTVLSRVTEEVYRMDTDLNIHRYRSKKYLSTYLIILIFPLANDRGFR
ncbi:hypothetical protein AA313_de0200446 [Arthrobotrys entomopaga]|nr:hypothetical protein AA313_de0200446 [Arthrobotrys entomopaga]